MCKVWSVRIVVWLLGSLWRKSQGNLMKFAIELLVVSAVVTAGLAGYVNAIDDHNETAIRALLVIIALAAGVLTHDIGKLFGIRLLATGGRRNDMTQMAGIAIKVQGPLSLAGLFGVILFGIFKLILGLPIFTALPANAELQLLYHMIDVIFVVGLVALVLGLASFVLLRVLKR